MRCTRVSTNKTSMEIRKKIQVKMIQAEIHDQLGHSNSLYQQSKFK